MTGEEKQRTENRIQEKLEQIAIVLKQNVSNVLLKVLKFTGIMRGSSHSVWVSVGISVALVVHQESSISLRSVQWTSFTVWSDALGARRRGIAQRARACASLSLSLSLSLSMWRCFTSGSLCLDSLKCFMCWCVCVCANNSVNELPWFWSLVWCINMQSNQNLSRQHIDFFFFTSGYSRTL